MGPHITSSPNGTSTSSTNRTGSRLCRARRLRRPRAHQHRATDRPGLHPGRRPGALDSDAGTSAFQGQPQVGRSRVFLGDYLPHRRGQR